VMWQNTKVSEDQVASIFTLYQLWARLVTITYSVHADVR